MGKKAREEERGRERERGREEEREEEGEEEGEEEREERDRGKTNTTSMRPNFLRAASNALSTEAVSVTSRSTAKKLSFVAPSNFSFELFLAVATTLSPSFNAFLTSSLPKPVDVPVMKKTCGAMVEVFNDDICTKMYEIYHVGTYGYRYVYVHVFMLPH